MPIELRVLCGRELLGADGRPVDQLLAQPKRFALLVYLVVDRPTRSHTRDELLAMFWADYPEDKARNALSQALTFIRRTLGDGVIVTRGLQDVSVDREAIQCDAVMLEAAVDRGDFEVAVGLHQRDFLDGFHVDDAIEFEQWLDRERSHLRDRVTRCASELSARAAAGNDPAAALTWAQRKAALAPFDESAARAVIVLYQANGEHAAAIQAFDAYAGRLWGGLRLKPTPELTTLVDRLRNSDTQAATAPAEMPHALVRTIAAPLAVPPGLVPALRPSRARRIGLVAGAGALAVSALGATAMIARRHDATPQGQHAQISLALDDSVRPRTDQPGVTVALSRDGSRLAYVGGDSKRIYLRTLRSLVPRAVDGTEGAMNLQFSPDGAWLAFVVGGKLTKIPLAGGPAVVITDSVARFSWGDGDVVVFARNAATRRTGLWQVSAGGGPIKELTTIDTVAGERSHTWPAFLPGGQAVVFEIHDRAVDSSEIAVVRLADGKVTRLGIHGCNPRYLPTGDLVFGRFDGWVFTAPFDVANFRVTGGVIPVLQNVIVKSGGATELAIADNGTLIYFPAANLGQLVAVDRSGRSEPLIPSWQSFEEPRISPDGKRVAVTIGSLVSRDVWIYDVPAGTRTRVTHDGHSDHPAWIAGGRQLIWRTTVATSDSTWFEIRRQEATLAGAVDTLALGPRTLSMSPRGDFFATTRRHGVPAVDETVIVPIRDPARRVTLTPRDRRMLTISPDGLTLAYNANSMIFVEPISGAGAAHQVIAEEATEPVWGPSGRQLFMRSRGKLLAVTLAMAPAFAVLRVDTLFADAFETKANSIASEYDVMPDGARFVFVKSPTSQLQPVMIFGWLDELRARGANKLAY